MHPRVVLVAVGLVAVLAACQPAAPPAGAGEGAEDAQAAASDPDDPPAGQVPGTVQALVEATVQTAEEWQAGARPVELFFVLDDEVVVEGQITWMAPGAGQQLVVTTTPDGTGQQRPTLATLQLPVVPEAGLAEVPDPPEEVPAIVELAAAGADGARACGVATVETVHLGTGAPAAWDGTAWVEPPTWRVTLADDDARVQVDPASGEPLTPC